MSWGTVHTEPIVPLGLIGLLGLLGFFFSLLQFWVLRKKVGRGRALLISLFRLGALLGLIAFALNPLRITQREHRVRPTLAILLETSQSMKFPGKGPGRTRLDEAKEVLLGGSWPLLKSLTERYEVKIYGVGQSLVPLEIGQIASLSAGGKQGDLSQAIAKIREESAVVLLLSDGKLRWHAKAPDGPSILSIPLGDPETYKDVLIKEVKAPPMAFREREVVLDVTLRSYGYKGILLPVALKEGSRLLSARTVPIRQSPEEVKLSFSFIPRVVTAGVPIRKPLGFSGGAVSPGIELLFVTIPARSSAFASFLPGIFLFLKSIKIKWLSVPPETRLNPYSIIFSASFLAFATTCLAYTTNSGVLASVRATASDAIVCM